MPSGLYADGGPATGMPYYPEVIAIPEPMARPETVRVAFGIEPTGVPIDPNHACTAVPLRWWPSARPGRRDPGRASGSMISWPTSPRQPEMRSTSRSSWTNRAIFPTSPREDWMAARRARQRFEPSGYSHILMAGNTLWASVESDCLPSLAHKPATVKSPRLLVASRSQIRSEGRSPEWLPDFYARHCQAKTKRLVIPNLDIDLGIDVPSDPGPFCRLWFTYLAGGI